MAAGPQRRVVADPAVTPARARWWAWLLAGTAIFVLSLVGVHLTPPGGSVAAWWPAAGVSALFILLVPRAKWWLLLTMVVVVTAAANVIAGRDAAVAGAFGLANAVEVGIFATILLWRRRGGFRLRSVSAAWRLALATIAGSAVLGVLIGIVVADTAVNPFQTAANAAASHAAAILMIAPFAVLPPHLGQPIRWVEITVQVVLLGGILAFLVSAGTSMALTFLPIGILAWAAFRFPIRAAYTESLLANVIVLGATIAGLGPFVVEDLSPRAAVLLVTLFLFMTASTNLFLTAASYELRAATLSAQNAADLVTSGMVDSRVGLLVAERRADAWAVLLANTAARGILGPDLDDRMRWRRGLLRDAAQQSVETQRLVTLETGERVLNIDASETGSATPRVSVQLVDITETIRLTQDRLAAETERATTLAARLELDRRQVDFIATASHELRTPIANVSGYLELLDEMDDLPELSREWIDIARRNTTRLEELIDDLLFLARAKDHATAPVLHVPTPAADLVDEALRPFRDAARRRRMELIIEQSEGTVHGVRHELVRAVSSLVSNSLKFAPAGTTVRVVASPDPDGLEGPDGWPVPAVRITVSDEGPGIAPEDLPHVFDRFYRTPDAEVAQTAGAGLGLAITRELVETNGGRVEIASPDRRGVVATLILPAVSTASDAVRAGHVGARPEAG